MIEEDRYDQPVLLAQALAAFSARPSPATLWRWTRRGVNNAVLRTMRLGKKIYTTRRWIDEFVAAQSITPVQEDTEANQRTAQTEERLRKSGLLRDNNSPSRN